MSADTNSYTCENIADIFCESASIYAAWQKLKSELSDPSIAGTLHQIFRFEIITHQACTTLEVREDAYQRLSNETKLHLRDLFVKELRSRRMTEFNLKI